MSRNPPLGTSDDPRGPSPTTVPVDRRGIPFADRLSGRDYVSVSVTEHGRPRPLVADTRVEITFRSDALSAAAGCNWLNFPMVVDGGRLITGPYSSTLIGCSPERLAQDQWLGDFLAASPAWEQTGDTLTLASGDTV